MARKKSSIKKQALTSNSDDLQAARFLAAAKAAGVTENSFARAMGKISLQKQARKPKG